MAAHRYPMEYDRPRTPLRPMSWFMQLLMVLAVLILAGVVYGFWTIAQAPSPALDLPEMAPPTQPAPRPEPPTNRAP